MANRNTHTWKTTTPEGEKRELRAQSDRLRLVVGRVRAGDQDTVVKRRLGQDVPDADDGDRPA